MDTSLSTELSAYRVPTNEVHGAWAIARPFIKRAHSSRFSTGDAFLEDIYARLLLGDAGPLKAALWIAFDGPDALGAMVTHIVRYERSTVLQIPYLAGEQFDRWAHLISVVADDAGRRGCSEVEILSREGFGPILADYGCEKKWTMFRMPVGAK